MRSVGLLILASFESSLRCDRRFGGHVLLGDLDDGVEVGGGEDGDFAEHLSVELDVGGLEPEDEPAVGDAAHLAGGAESASRDVLHSFSVPVFRLKQDAVPGRIIRGWFEALPNKTGEYDIQCAEICGIGHGIMGARIFVESPEEHAAWNAQHSLSLAAAIPQAGIR